MAQRFFRLWAGALLVLLAPLAQAKWYTKTLSWVDGSKYGPYDVEVGNTINLVWDNSGDHNVYRLDTASCDADGTEVAPTSSSGTFSYTFVEEDAGQTVTFACSPGHCDEGQMVTFNVLELDESMDESSAFTLCFSDNTKAHVRSKGMVAIQDIQVGDWVQVGKDSYHERVYALGHHMSTKEATFLQIKTSGIKSALEVTGDHLLYLKDSKMPIPARDVKFGDVLMHVEGQDAVVTSIESIKRKGIYAPLTPSGALVVNGGIVASSYGTVQQTPDVEVAGKRLPMLSQGIAVHMALSPLRWWCGSVSNNSGICHWQHPNSGMNGYVHFMLQLVRWGEQQAAVVQWILFAVGFVLLGLIYTLEWIFQEPDLLIPFAAILVVAVTSSVGTVLAASRKQLKAKVTALKSVCSLMH